jgi:hypothetical protein
MAMKKIDRVKVIDGRSIHVPQRCREHVQSYLKRKADAFSDAVNDWIRRRCSDVVDIRYGTVQMTRRDERTFTGDYVTYTDHIAYIRYRVIPRQKKAKKK